MYPSDLEFIFPEETIPKEEEEQLIRFIIKHLPINIHGILNNDGRVSSLSVKRKQ